MVLNPFENTTLKASYGKHFNAPTPNDLYWPYEDWGWGSGAQGNSNLKPETGKNVDVTLEKSILDEKIFFSVSYFDWDIENRIRWVSDENWFYRPENIDELKGDGFELGIKAKPFYGLTCDFSFTQTKAKEIKTQGIERDALYNPDNQFKGKLSYLTYFDLTTSVDVQYVGKRPARYNLDTDTKPEYTFSSYWLTGIKLQKKLNQNILLSFEGHNIFNKTFGTYVANFKNEDTGVTTVEDYPSAGQSFFINLSYEY